MTRGWVGGDRGRQGAREGVEITSLNPTHPIPPPATRTSCMAGAVPQSTVSQSTPGAKLL